MEATTTARPVGKRALAMVAVLAAAHCASTAGTAQAKYVALGDSYTAGPLIPNPVLPIGCLKSSNNYPRLTAPRIGQSLKDASCSGADDDTHEQLRRTSASTGRIRRSSTRLGAGTRMVSITIGGNDIGFSAIAQDCITLNPFGNPCKKSYIVNGVDTISQRIAATARSVDAVLDGIRARSPLARTFVLNYPAIFPETGSGCFPQMPIAWTDAPYLRAKQQELNAMIAGQAAANGARLVNWYAASIGRDACKGSSTRWVEPLIPGNWAASIHPNRRGIEGAANALVAAVNTP